MKLKFFTAIVMIAMLLTLSSCSWFGNHGSKENPLLGKWRIDSLSSGKDSGSASLAVLLFYLAKDSAKTVLEFKKDTVVSWVGTVAEERKSYQFDMGKSTLVVKDKVDQQFQFTRGDDSSATLKSADLSYYLRRL